MKRAWLIYTLLKKNIDWIIIIGVWLGFLLGLSVAVGNNLLVQHIMESYQRFVQKSLIGIRGSIQLNASSKVIDRILTENQALWATISHSYAWSSQGPIGIEMQQGTQKWKRQVTVVVNESEYFKSKLQSQMQCNEIGDQISAFGNRLLFKTLVGLDKSREITVKIPEMKNKTLKIQFPHSDSCQVDTGMMTVYPILFLNWESLNINPIKELKNFNLEVFTLNRLSAEKWANIIDETADEAVKKLMNTDLTIPPEDLEYSVNNLFDADEMKLANSIARQASDLSWLVIILTGFLSVLTLFFGLSLLIKLKNNVIETIRKIGASSIAISFSFAIKGSIYGFMIVVTGITLAFSGEYIITAWHLIPFEHFFSPWNLSQLPWLMMGSILVVGLFSGIIAYFAMWQLKKQYK